MPSTALPAASACAASFPSLCRTPARRSLKPRRALQRAVLYAAAGRSDACARLAEELEALPTLPGWGPPLAVSLRELQEALRGGETGLGALGGPQAAAPPDVRDLEQALGSLAALLHAPLLLLFADPALRFPPPPGAAPGAGSPDQGETP